MEVRSTSPHEGQRRLDVRLVLSFFNRNGGSYRRMNGTGKGKSCRSDGCLLLLLLFVVRKSEGYGLDLEKI